MWQTEIVKTFEVMIDTKYWMCHGESTLIYMLFICLCNDETSPQ